MTMTMSAFEDRLRRNARSDRHPTSAVVELTPTCNLRCKFCYVALAPYKGPYLSTEQVCRIFDVLADAEILWLTLTGGEIFTRRDFVPLYRHARSRGFLVTLFTNATMVTEAHAELLADEPPFSVEVSIYGADAEHYEGTTQIPGSFARFERGVARLQAAGVSLLMKTPVSTLSESHLPAISAWCEARGLRLNLDPSMDPTHYGDQTPTLYRIDSKRILDVQREVMALNHIEIAEPLADCNNTLPVDESAGMLYRCHAGRTSLFVDGLGRASHCVIDREPGFPILEMPWDELWRQMGEWVTQPLPADAPCSGCSLRSGCSNCPARSRLATGSPFLKDTYYCDVTHIANGLAPAVHAPALTARRPLGACVS